MPARKKHVVIVKDHPGSTYREIEAEPEWSEGHQHRVGFRNPDGRWAGYTHVWDSHERKKEVKKLREESEAKEREERERLSRPELVNFRQIVENQPDYHIWHKDLYNKGYRYVLDVTEDWVKSEQDWPINKKKKEEEAQKEIERKSKEKHEEKQTEAQDSDDKNDREQNKSDGEEQETRGQEEDRNDNDDETTIRRADLGKQLRDERGYISQLEQNRGDGVSPLAKMSKDPGVGMSIDETDQFTPDNWIPRSKHLIRVTGKHPVNAEPDLSALYEAGLITPNRLHYIRNHGSVPHLLWEKHKLEVVIKEGQSTIFSMDDLDSKFKTINIPVLIACDGNRRGELNLIRRSKGFNFGAGAAGCAYWKGPRLRDVLLAAGVRDPMVDDDSSERCMKWVNFEGADELSEGSYQTCIRIEHAMDFTMDVILAYEMNDAPLPPDHGYPIRLVIPGFVGGRCVKWLKKIWLSENENDTYYHIWDNRVLPEFITDQESQEATIMYSHPSTACNEQQLNSVVAKPAHGAVIDLTKLSVGAKYEIAGFAYSGGGHEVQRVEVSLDDGITWQYTSRIFPERPIRHGRRFWTWIHWKAHVRVADLLESKSITVRCFDVFKNTQPKDPNWNIMGMMNNCWYSLRGEVAIRTGDTLRNPDEHKNQCGGDQKEEGLKLIFKHPTIPGSATGGWKQPSTEVMISEAKQESVTPAKQFTREEVEKHHTKEDCWIVVDGKVYDATSVLSWHPGGQAPILGHAGKVHQETTDEYEGIHDAYAQGKLKECLLGTLTSNAHNFLKWNAAAKKHEATDTDETVALQKHKWVPVILKGRDELTHDTRKYTFHLPQGKTSLGIATGQHLLLGFHLKDKMLIRPYTPTFPILPDEDNGTFELTVKTYFPDENQPGGAMSNILDCIPIGEEIEAKGPEGDIVYEGGGTFNLAGEKKTFKRISLISGGSGITPVYQIITRVLRGEGDDTKIRAVSSNKAEDDILMREELEKFEKEHEGQFKITHVLEKPRDDWEGERGLVNKDILAKYCFEANEESIALMCGPPGMIKHAVLPALKELGYKEEENCFGF